MTTYTRIELSREPNGQPLYQKFVNGRYTGVVRSVPLSHCEECGAPKPAGQSCGCFDNGCQ